MARAAHLLAVLPMLAACDQRPDLQNVLALERAAASFYGRIKESLPPRNTSEDLLSTHRHLSAVCQPRRSQKNWWRAYYAEQCVVTAESIAVEYGIAYDLAEVDRVMEMGRRMIRNTD